MLTINSDAGWDVPFCIKFWTERPSIAYFAGYNGEKYVNCRPGDEPSQMVVMFDNHNLPVGQLMMQIAYHTHTGEFPQAVFDDVTNAYPVIIDIDGTDHLVALDFTGDMTPEIMFDLPAFKNEEKRIQNEQQRIQNELDREQATAAAVQGAENVNAQLNGYVLTVTNRQGVSSSINTKGETGDPIKPEFAITENGHLQVPYVIVQPD